MFTMGKVRGDQKTLARREKIKKETIQLCRKQNWFFEACKLKMKEVYV